VPVIGGVMKYIRENNSNIPYSLHDSRIIEMQFEDGVLTFKLDQVFEYTDDGEISHPAEICFTDVDLDDCYVSVFDRTLSEGEFKGERYSIKAYIEKFKGAEFEILTEGYNGYDKSFVGWIWNKDSIVSGFISIWTQGDMIYNIG